MNPRRLPLSTLAALVLAATPARATEGNPGAYLHAPALGIDLVTSSSTATRTFQMWNLGRDNVSIVGNVVPVEPLRFGVE